MTPIASLSPGARAWRKMCRSRADEQGVGMIMAILVTAAVFMLTAIWYGMADHQIERATHERHREQAAHAAEAGIHRAMALIAEDPSRTDAGQPAGYFTFAGDIDQNGDRFGQYDVTVEAPRGVNDPLRRITADAWMPRQSLSSSTTAPAREQIVQRRVFAEVEASFTTGFDYVLFATEEIDGDSTLLVSGDIYSEGFTEWEWSSAITGDVLSWGGIDSRGTVTGNLKSAGELPASLLPGGSCTASGDPCGIFVRSGTVNGSVFAAANGTLYGGNVDVVSHNPASDPTPNVTGNAWAEGVITKGSSSNISGTETQGIAPPLPVDEAMPTFDPTAYTWNDHSSPADFDAWFDTRSDSLVGPFVEGNQRITAGTGTVELGGTHCTLLCPPSSEVAVTTWKMSGDVVIYTDQKVKLSADISNDSSPAADLDLVIISTYDSSPTDYAVEITGNVTPPDTVDVLVYAPNGQVRADSTAQDLHGVIYAESIKLADHFNITHADFSSVSGFTFSLPGHVPVKIKHYREEIVP